jgi:hypothetical protein
MGDAPRFPSACNVLARTPEIERSPFTLTSRRITVQTIKKFGGAIAVGASLVAVLGSNSVFAGSDLDQTVAAGDQAQALGVAWYEVNRHDEVTEIHLFSKTGSELGQITLDGNNRLSFRAGYAGQGSDIDFEKLIRTVLNDPALRDSGVDAGGCGAICIVCFCTIDACVCVIFCC